MSVDYYRGQIQRLTKELATLESRTAEERNRAARERAEALRQTQSIAKSTSPSSAQSKMRDAQRREERAVQHDGRAAQHQREAARKRGGLIAAEKNLERAINTRLRRDARAVANRSIDPVTIVANDELVLDTPVLSNAGAGDAEPSVPIQVVRLAAESNADAGLELAKATALGALSAVPVLGPVLSQVVAISWGDNRAARLERFAVELGRNVEALQERVDAEFVKHSGFAALAEESIERVVVRRNHEKIGRFAAAVAHSATLDRPDGRCRERFLDWLDELRPIHVQILDRLASPSSGWTRTGNVISPGQVVQSRLAHALAGLDWDQLDIADLQRRGLLGLLDDTGTILAAADRLDALVSPLGRMFLVFITAESEPDLGTG